MFKQIVPLMAAIAFVALLAPGARAERPTCPCFNFSSLAALIPTTNSFDSCHTHPDANDFDGSVSASIYSVDLTSPVQLVDVSATFSAATTTTPGSCTFIFTAPDIGSTDYTIDDLTTAEALMCILNINQFCRTL